MKIPFIALAFSLCIGTIANAQSKTDSLVKAVAITTTTSANSSKWYDKLSIRGYAQLRYNGLLETNTNLQCEQCDKSWGGPDDFFFRRIRLILFGQISEHVYLYVQPDFAVTTDNKNLHFGQIRDFYFDLGLTKNNTVRLRLGQSKVPYGFENLQSSQNRVPLDRNDAMNSAVANERDLGAFLYWAPKNIRERFSYLVSSGLKGSGDYGVIGIGVYNGQTANKPEPNENKHLVIRASYPIELKTKRKQIIEPGIQAYTGKCVVASVSSGVKGINANYEYLDQRIAGSIVVYPQPFGIQAEYNIGTGPEFNPQTKRIEQKSLKGGYVMGSYLAKIKQQTIMPFVRYHYYHGGKKQEQDARSYGVDEWEGGVEWQPTKSFEFTALYAVSNRRFEDAAKLVNLQSGSLLRLQAQVNF